MRAPEPHGADAPSFAAHAPRPMFHRVISAELPLVRETLTAVRARFLDDIGPDAMGRLELVLAEVMNNVAKHGAGKGTAPAPLIHLCIVSHSCGLACALTDDGDRLPPECLLPRNLPQLPDNELPEGGFGWYLIQDLTQELCYYREDTRNFLAFRIPLLQAAAQGIS